VVLLAFPLQSGEAGLASDGFAVFSRIGCIVVLHFNERARTRPSLVHGLLAQFAPVPMIVER
jgi:hypothetical protein